MERKAAFDSGRRIALVAVALVFGLVILAFAPAQAQAKTVTKDGWYLGQVLAGKSYDTGSPGVWKATFSTKKLTTRGALGYSGKYPYYGWTTAMQRKSAKRTFRVSGRTKYYLSRGRYDKRRETKISKTRFVSLVHEYNNRWLYFHVSGGRVVKMIVTSEH